MARQVPIHYLRPNETEWTPPCVAALDTETYQIGGNVDVQALRCWAMAMVERPAGNTDHDTRRDATGSTVDTLASCLELWMRGRETLWVYVHNLGFDLAVTRLPVVMAEQGWTVTDFAIDGRAPWMRLSKGRKRITLCDSWSWIPRALAAIASEVGITKPPLPGDDDSPETWLARCQADVDILLTCMTQLMDWWQSSHRGRWTVTGAASGWNAYRHTPTPFKVTIDTTPELMAHDRSAIYGGKRYVNRVGKLTPGGYLEVDFARAYTTVAAHLPLPTARTRPFDSLPNDDPRIESERWGIIAEVEIDTRFPRYPRRDAGRVWYPVGRFRTTLASPEIAEARSRGELVSIGHGYTYKLLPHMAPWARWCLELIDDTSGSTPGVVRLAARQWGRSVIGKWAQRQFTHITLGAAPTIGWGYETAWMAGTHTRASIVDLAGTRYMCYPDGDGENAFPAILAFVESHVRVRLNRAIAAVGDSAFVQCDTDGFLVGANELLSRARQSDTFTSAKSRNTDVVNIIMDKVSALTDPLELRVKATYKRVEVIGPQHLRLDGMRRFSGVPSKGEDLADGSVGAWVWPKLAHQMAHGDARGYVRHYRHYRVPRNLASGWVATDGRVYPVQYAIARSGQSLPLAWHDTDAARSGVILAQSQNRDVLHLIEQSGGG